MSFVPTGRTAALPLTPEGSPLDSILCFPTRTRRSDVRSASERLPFGVCGESEAPLECQAEVLLSPGREDDNETATQVAVVITVRYQFGITTAREWIGTIGSARKRGTKARVPAHAQDPIWVALRPD
jgi:hypothetical protein